MTHNCFRSINRIFFSNTKGETALKESLALNKLRKGNATYSMQKFILGWEIDTVQQVLTLPEDCKGKLKPLINTIPTIAHRCSHCHWQK